MENNSKSWRRDKKKETVPRVLIISNEPFSGGSSNGRTMMNMLLTYDRKCLAQFYIHGEPNQTFCENYYQVSDRLALNAFLHKRAKRGNVESSSGEKNEEKKVPRNCRNLLLRDMVWMSFAWWNREFDAFLEKFSPEVVLLQAGDAPFMFAIARRIARRCRCPLVMYNSENYVLKRYLYSSARNDGIWHILLQRRLRHEYKKIMDQVSCCVYSMERLEADYQQVYPHSGKSMTLYTVSELSSETVAGKSNGRFEVVYCGNLGVGRAEPLAEFAKVLYEVDPEAKLMIYGKFVSEEDRLLVCANPAVEYCGVVDYAQVPDILRGADMIIHCENPGRVENLRNAFSTKIADSLAVGTPFLVYASRQYPFVQYLLKNRCAHIAETPQELKAVLTQCRQDAGYREQYLQAAKRTAEENHSVANNCRKMQEMLCAVGRVGK